MIEWVEELNKGLAAEFSERKPKRRKIVCMLATADKNGAAWVRVMQSRKVLPDGSIWIVSDARSEKNEHLKASPDAEVCFWLSEARDQYRVSGKFEVLSADSVEPERVESWMSLDDRSRAQFFWPSPGTERDKAPDAFPMAVAASVPAPASFELLILHPSRVEHVNTLAQPPRRRRWTLAGNWSAVELNP